MGPEGLRSARHRGVIAFMLTRIRLLRTPTATAVLFSIIIFLAGGIVGTFYHLYFSGSWSGCVFWERRSARWTWCRSGSRRTRAYWGQPLKCPLTKANMSRISGTGAPSGSIPDAGLSNALAGKAVVGRVQVAGLLLRCGGVLEPDRAGLFGFLINLPIALHYMQGQNANPVHGHGDVRRVRDARAGAAAVLPEGAGRPERVEERGRSGSRSGRSTGAGPTSGGWERSPRRGVSSARARQPGPLPH